MRSIKTKLLALIVCISIIAASFNPIAAYAVTFDTIDGINYSRIYMTLRDYEVYATVGGYVFPGKITREADFDETEINKYISIFMERNKVTSYKLKEAETVVQNAIALTKHEANEIVGDMIQTIAGIIGDDLGEAVVADLRGCISAALFASDTVKNSSDISSVLTVDNLETFFAEKTKYLRDKFVSPYGFSRYVIGMIIDGVAKKHPVVKAITTVWDTGKFCYDSYQRYMKMIPLWEQAMAYKLFLDDFYRRLNIYLDNVFKNRAKFTLTVSGDKTRKFKFLGTDNNYQYWQVSFLLKRERAYGNRKYSPAGEYRGSAAIVLSHAMFGFDAMLWELPVGPFEKFWFTKATCLILNGVQLVKGQKSGWSYISRVIESKDARLTVYSDEGNGSGWVRLKSSMDMSGFKDTIKTSSTQKASMDSAVGFAGNSKEEIAAAMYVDVKMHLEGNEFGTFDMVLDKANAKFESVLGINASENQGTRLITRVWDSNIWAPLQNKTAGFEIRGYIYEEAMQ